MLNDNSTEEIKNVIHVEGLYKYLSNGERKEINNILHSNNIEIDYHEIEPKASLFEALIVFFNEPLTMSLISGLLTSTASDAIKFVVLRLLSKIKKIYFASFNSSKNKLVKRKCSNLDLHINIGNINVDVLMTNNYTHKQNLEYLDKVFSKIIELGKTQPQNLQTNEFFVIENDDKNPKSLKTMTMVEYAKEQQRKQESKKK
jgi:hypothetical protein